MPKRKSPPLNITLVTPKYFKGRGRVEENGHAAKVDSRGRVMFKGTQIGTYSAACGLILEADAIAAIYDAATITIDRQQYAPAIARAIRDAGKDGFA